MWLREIEIGRNEREREERRGETVSKRKKISKTCWREGRRGRETERDIETEGKSKEREKAGDIIGVYVNEREGKSAFFFTGQICSGLKINFFVSKQYLYLAK